MDMERGSDRASPVVAPADDRDIQLAAMVPLRVKRAVLKRAVEEGTTVRAIILRALQAFGIDEVQESDLHDRRSGGVPQRNAPIV